MSSIGQSYEGRELWAVKVSSSAAVDDPAKPDVLVTGCYHAREWIAVEVPYALALRLPALYASDPRVRFLLDTTEVWIAPLVNPDGHAYSQTEPNHATGGVRLWRKNRRPVDLDGDGRPEGVGVDLNRNHGHAWRLAGDAPYPNVGRRRRLGRPGEPNVYQGPGPDSELEVRALNRLTADPTHEFAARLDYHNFSQLILYPLGYSPGPAVDDALLSSLALRMQTEIRLVRNVSYTVKPSFALYLTTGSSTDYAYGHDRQVAYAIELSPRSGGFDLDESQIPAVVDENIPGALALVEWAAGPATVRSVRAAQAGSIVTSLEWEREGTARILAAETRQALRPGALSVEVTFSRPLSGAPRLTIQAGETTLSPPVQPGEPARYPGDTWIAVIDVPAVAGLEFVRLRAEPEQESAGVAGFDADPSTVAAYGIGTGRWQGFEANAPDASYVLGLSPDEDLPPAVGLLAPGTIAPAGDGLPSEVFLAGSEVRVSWQARDDRGIVEQRLEYSTDGGATFEAIDGAQLDPLAREFAWRTPARLSSATVVLRLTAIDGGGNQTRAVTAQPIAISRLAITRAPVYAGGRLRVTVSPGALKRVSHVQPAIDGVPVADSRVRWSRDRNRVMLRGSLGELGLEAGRSSQLRLVADGVPAPSVEFTP